MPRFLLITSLFVLFCSSFLWALFFRDEGAMQRLIKKVEERGKESDLQFKEVTVSEMVEGTKYWELTARTAKINKFYQITKLDEVTGNFFDQEKPVLYFQSPTALWEMKKKRVILKDLKGITLASGNKTTLTSNQVIWSLASKKIQARHNVRVRAGSMTLYGQTLTGDVSLKEIKLTGKPRAILEQ